MFSFEDTIKMSKKTILDDFEIVDAKSFVHMLGYITGIKFMDGFAKKHCSFAMR
jgi:hypothetical protein